MPERESEHASPTGKRACHGVTKAGEPCRSTSLDESGFCAAHRTDMRALGKLGGRARGRKKEQRAGDKLEALAHTAIEEMLRSSSGSATARAAAAKLALERIPSASAELGRRAASAEIEARMRQELPTARAKLARLIDARVEARATEMYEERIKLEAEAVAAELRVDEQ